MNTSMIRLLGILFLSFFSLTCIPDQTTDVDLRDKEDFALVAGDGYKDSRVGDDLAAAYGFHNFNPPPPKIGGVRRELVFGESLGYGSNIAVNDQVHVAAEVNRAVVVLHYEPKGLTYETVAPLGAPGDLKVDSAGHLHLLYWHGVDARLFYATDTDGAWRREDLGIKADCHNPSLALTVDDRPQVAFTRYDDGALLFADREADQWHIEQVDDVGARASLSLLPDGTPVISYSEEYGPLRVARRDGGVWSSEVVHSGIEIIQNTALVAEAPDALHVVYADYEPNVLYYARYNGDGWQTEAINHVVDLPANLDLVQDSTGLLHFSFYDEYGDDKTHCVHGVSGDWTIEHVNAGQYPDLAIDDAGALYLSYRYYGLAFAASDTGWTPVHVAPPPTYSDPDYTDLAFDAEGAAHVSFLDQNTLSLYYATDATGAWTAQKVEGAGAVGEYSAIALGAGDEVYLAYSVSEQGGVRLATYDGAWTYEDVDPTAYAGIYLDLATDAAGDPRIAYFVGGILSNLRYAVRNGAAWFIEEVDKQGVVGKYPSLALAADGTPHIAYYLETVHQPAPQGDIRYAYRGTDGWEIETVKEYYMPGYNHLVLDSSDRPRLTFYGGGFTTHVYAWRTDAGWNLLPIDAETSNMIAGLTLDHADYPYLFSIADWPDEYVRVSRLVNGAWQHGRLDAFGRGMSAATDPAGDLRVVYATNDQVWSAKIGLNYP